LSGGHERAFTAALALKAKLSADTGLSAGSPLPLRIEWHRGRYQSESERKSCSQVAVTGVAILAWRVSVTATRSDQFTTR
jgi:hypothetical protein